MKSEKGKILVVDDDAFTAEMTGMILEMGGYETVLAEGGMDALEKISENPSIAMVVSDMNMPMIDGVELYTELREQGYTQPFILITGDDAAPLIQAHPDIDAIITKDENIQEQLAELVETILAKKG